MPGQKESTLADSFISHLRQASRIACPVPGCSDGFPASDDRIRDHFNAKHLDYIEGKDLEDLIRQVKRGPTSGNQAFGSVGPAQGGGVLAEAQGTVDEAGAGSHRRRQPRAQSTSPTKRSRARPSQNTSSHDPDFRPRNSQQGKLWNPEEGLSPSSHKARPPPAKSSRSVVPPKGPDPEDVEEDEEALRLIPPPETRPISQEQLVAEVKGIYAGLMMVESKCIEVDNAQSSQTDTRLNNEQWQALIALHRTLLHEHHDFFLASQHPSASPALKRLASKYAMPARMWRHGIHSFLELLRHRLPSSLEHMLTFIYLAYSMIALLYETVPAFEDTWIECLGDLGRYRMAIEDEDIRDREIWTSVSRQWYSKASDKLPTTGRLYHHLAILARPNALQQLFYYSKSLCVPTPFASTKESIMTLFEPILGAGSYQHSRMAPIDLAFVKTQGILFSGKKSKDFHTVSSRFLEPLDSHISQMAKRWIEAGYYIAITNCCALLSYGKEENVIMRLIQHQNDEQQDYNVDTGTGTSGLASDFEYAIHLAMKTHEVVFNRGKDENVLPYTHVVMVFMFFLTQLPGTSLRHLERRFPWKLLSSILNQFLDSAEDYSRICGDDFPRESNNLPQPLPEDSALKGFPFGDKYYPKDWFSHEKDDDEKYFEKASMANTRKERILWLGHKIARSGRGLAYDGVTNRFSVRPEYEREIEAISKEADMMNISDIPHMEQRTANTTPLQIGTGDAMDVDEPPSTTPGIVTP